MITLESSTEVQRKQLEPGDSLALQNTRGLNLNTTDFKSEIDETSKSRLRRIGNQRPDVFSSIWEEIGFVFSISMSQILSEYFVSGFTVILPKISEDLNIPLESSVWPASAFSLTVASFLLIFGRVSDIYGGYPVYVAGCLWLAIWSLIGGFSNHEIMLNICRALQGLGPAAFLPSSVMVLGSIYRPGPRKNMVFSIYGACAPVGFFLGILFGGITAELSSWGWFFWVGAILSAVTAITSIITIPSDIEIKKLAKDKFEMDWLGSILIVGGLTLFSFAILDSSHAADGWRTSYIYSTFIIGSLLLLLAIYVEARVASQPLLPASLFKVPCMSALFLALLLTFGSFGIFLFYATFYMSNIMGASPFQVIAWYAPMAMGGCIVATFGGLILHLLPGTVLISISGISWIVTPLLFAIAPQGASYWANVFPSMICAPIGMDVTFNVANIFITTSLPRGQQGLAGAIISLLVHLGIAIMLGFADIINSYSVARLGLRQSYHAVFWFEVACAATALTILTLFVKIKRAESELTIEERAKFEKEEKQVKNTHRLSKPEQL
ncbi:putative MFS-type transporter [Golovinomyces cichoracearum]|uniref:Putative MFS-type transporter n=1 Tax=Golovinomyces cichoracearum TaxID=62708 RepID=A0A420J955_9PEZI|nr:putative MFS-type transporter [Golovinomyces cichoracearum]